MNEQQLPQPTKQASTSSPPWEPNRLSSYCFFITTLGADILLGLNWKRLGKPEWVLKTILISIAVHIIVFAVIFAWVFLLGKNIKDIPYQLGLSIPMLMFGVNFGYLFALARLQSGGYKKFKAAGFVGLQEFQYNVRGAFYYGGLVALAIMLLGTFVFPLLNGR